MYKITINGSKFVCKVDTEQDAKLVIKGLIRELLTKEFGSSIVCHPVCKGTPKQITQYQIFPLKQEIHITELNWDSENNKKTITDINSL